MLTDLCHVGVKAGATCRGGIWSRVPGTCCEPCAESNQDQADHGADRQLFAQQAHPENQGHERRYEVHVDGRSWTFDGATERARIEFSADGRSQRVVWEWKPRERWLPLCDRTAVRVD